ncbi:glycoside hydrolase family 92 protein [bacterium]|nr:MAG: glycoside hydrolase family 92 protein [bacterium]
MKISTAASCLGALLLTGCIGSNASAQEKAKPKKFVVDYVDPFIGTGRSGKTFPGATTPSGMTQLSPDTITGGDNGSGYRHSDKTIQGFSFTHMSGVGWYGDLGNFLVMPTTGPLKTWYGETNKPGTGYLSSFDNNSEVAQAGYYAVTLDDYKVRAEATASPHGGMLRFTFPQNQQSRIQIDLARRVGGTSLRQTVEVVGPNTIEGQIECTPQGGGWGHGAGQPRYTVYYRAEFSCPLQDFGVWSAKLPTDQNYSEAIEKPWFAEACKNADVLPGTRKMEGRHLGFYANFPTQANEHISLKVGLSFVSIEGARRNLATEIPAWNFDQLRTKARNAWAKELSRMEVGGGNEEEKTTFYTALYHTLIDPRLFSDVNGDYPGGDGKPHPTKKFLKRTIFSGWDVYRSAFPLLTIIAPNTVNDMTNSMIELAEQNGRGYFDRWEFLNAYSGCMNGSPAVVVINDAYQKGIRNFDLNKAVTFSDKTVELVKQQQGDPFLLSQQMENRNAEWNVSQLAKAAGQNAIAEKWAKSAATYRDNFDPNVPWTYDEAGSKSNPNWKGWFRARDKEGNFTPWRGLETEKTCQECSVYQQGWLVPYDVPGLMQLVGGREAFVDKLSDFFDRTPKITDWNPYYNHPNEPVHLIPFLFNRAGAPWLTQKWVRTIAQTYKTGPNGLCGDEDVGQMSSWFILAASGIHQACPGDTRYELFTPLFDRVQIRIDPMYGKNKRFTIVSHNNGPGVRYIQSARLNGRPLNRCWLDHKEIVAGGTLELELGAEPNKNWGI